MSSIHTMPYATEILRCEHRTIEQVLACLEELTDRAEKHGRLDAHCACRALDFLQNFADGYHRAKEEHHLFRLMEARGFPSGPPAVLQDEHQRGLKQIQAMNAFLAGAGHGDPDALDQFVALARTYVRLLREHIAKEENCLFPMIDETLTAEDQTKLLEFLSWVQASDQDADSYVRLAAELAKHLDLPTNRLDRPRAGAFAGGAQLKSPASHGGKTHAGSRG